MFRRSISFFRVVAVSWTGVVGAQQSASAPISDVHYEVTFTRANATRRVVNSAMSFTIGGSEPVLLSLPAWTPGSYEIANFSRNVANFSAEESGSVLQWDKVDQDTWRVRPAGAAVFLAIPRVA